MSQKRSAPVPDEPPDPSNSPIFQKLIELIEKQSTVLERQAQCLETLEKNVLKGSCRIS
ncbi:hypothetical protein SISSUDRAFT_1054269 [Sistotremastrum suecicum HHB10207 ss-3]|uniref:Uncharacterized protein n=1 Tax=Sistotremastrum suecicum HHB10207 ss-3 TaxID=1314776 RepID=A0A165YM89_9AGAM|nr:hypothetical protein SISSUDRAFT_1054269 [Sistotremastrum suecicum HHB10207 ss-3]